MTTKGDFVFDIDSVHKKPYESLIIGKKPLLVDGSLTDSDELPPSKAPRLVESHCVTTSTALISGPPEGNVWAHNFVICKCSPFATYHIIT